MSMAEPGTMPPPVTRSSSALPVVKRGASAVLPESNSRVTTRPRVALVIPDPGAGPASVSSVIVFHSLQDAHLPDHRDDVAPQFWQTKTLRWALAISERRRGRMPSGIRRSSPSPRGKAIRLPE